MKGKSEHRARQENKKVTRIKWIKQDHRKRSEKNKRLSGGNNHPRCAERKKGAAN